MPGPLSSLVTEPRVTVLVELLELSVVLSTPVRVRGLTLRFPFTAFRALAYQGRLFGRLRRRNREATLS
jgi:hypothetical protein